MRLIDADDLILTILTNDLCGDDNVDRAILNAPTIDAIPIEWIEEWLDKTTGTRDGEDISQLPEQLKFAIGMINLMEMDWEKENENN